MPPKNQRRSHTKSKKGCSQCKVRRIKCNEQHPICSNCERRQITCDFTLSPKHGTSTNSNNETNSSRSSSWQSPAHGSQGSQPSRTIDPFDQPDLVTTRKTTELDVIDIKLIHHYSTVLAYNLAISTRTETVPMWQTGIVQLAFKHDFLLRGILAVSAYHMAYLRPDKKADYDLIATTHQDIAMSSFQETLKQVDETNCHALFAFSCLIIIMSFSSRPKTAPTNLTSDLLHWFYLLRGADIVLNMHSEAISNSFLKPLLDEMAHSENTQAHQIADTERITDLFRICNVARFEREAAQAYTLAIHSLLSTFVQASLLRKRGGGTVLAGFVWPITLPPKFLEFLGENQPEALVILAHYCVVLYWGEANDNWFMAGWARMILDAVKASVPESWHEHLQWPDEVIVNTPPDIAKSQSSLPPQ